MSKLIGIHLSEMDAHLFIKTQEMTFFDYSITRVETKDSGMITGV